MRLISFVRSLFVVKTLVFFSLVSLSFIALYASNVQSASADAKKAAPLSKAQKWLYDRDHMKLMGEGDTVNYKFSRTSQLNDGYEDTVSVKLLKQRDNGRNDYHTNYFTGKRNKPYPDLTNYIGSPLIMFYLNRSVWEIAKVRLNGHPNYLRNRIREALYKTAKIENTTWTKADGKKIDAIKINIKPFTDSKYVGRFAHYSEVEYDFILSDKVKGEILEIRTTIPAKPKMDSQSIANMKKGKMTVLAAECEKVLTADDTKPLVQEVLRLVN